MQERWTVCAKRADFKGIGERFGIDQVVARLIRNRDIEGDEAIRNYLYGDLNCTHAPALMADMKIACEIIKKKIYENKKIRIISDYDVDGVMSNYILYDGLSHAGADVSYEIPDRMLDGYGINERIINAAREDGIDTIITCDNGIAATDAIALAKSYGMTVVVTDHHEVPYEADENGDRCYQMVNADAVVDIKRPDCEYPFKGLCGAGVVYKFIRELYYIMGIPWENEELYLDMLAIATVCDVMELRDENRVFVKLGMKVIEQTKNVGLRALLKVNNLIGKNIKAYHLGFIIGPCINATGRLDSAKEGLMLLLERDEKRALEQADKLLKLNITRKEMTNQGVEAACRIVRENYMENKVLLLYLGDMHESLAGIVAGKVREQFYKPVFVVTDAEGGILKGSGRSIEGYHMYDALTECKDLLLKFGGHELAAGFSLKKDNLEVLRSSLNKLQNLTEENLTPVVRIDVPMPIGYISEKLVNELDLLEPFGKGNEKPVFGQSGLRIKRATFFGTDNRFIRLILMDKNGFAMEAVDFNANKLIESIKLWFSVEECDRMLKGLPNNILIDVAYYPDVNEYNGRKTLQIKPITYRKHEEEN